MENTDIGGALPQPTSTSKRRRTRQLQIGASAAALALLVPVTSSRIRSGDADAATAATSGRVFNDVNSNGVADPGEVGVPGVTVTVFDDAGAVVGTAVTAAASPSTNPTAGTWSVGGTEQGTPYRVEYTNLQGFFPGKLGTANGSTVQFVAGGSTSSSLGLSNPQSFNGASTNVISGIQMNGDPTAVGTNLTGFTSVTNHPYSSTGVLSGGVAATQTATGTVFGIGVNRVTQRIYAGAFVKRHAGLGGAGGDAAGAIYEINPATAAVVGTITIPNTGPVPSNATRGLTADRTVGNKDAAVWPMVGTHGLGGVEVSDDGKTLWVVNMFDKSLYSVDLASGATTGTLVSAIPDPGCVKGVWRPMGLKYHLGKLYAGGVCDASTGGTAADLRAVVQVFDPATGTWAATPALSAPLNYPRQDIYRDSLRGDFHPWTNDWAKVKANAPLAGVGFAHQSYPMPMLGDIEFLDDGSMVIAIRDRAGDMLGHQNFAPDHTATVESKEDGMAGGDLLRAAPPATVGGSYVMEANGSVNGLTGATTTSNSGPGGAEFYSGEGWIWNGVQYHHESSGGGLAFKSGSGQILNSQYDPFVAANAGGYGFLQNSTGALSTGAEVYAGGTEFFGKANGMAELELLTEAAPIEIGNRVWLDADRDGVQDPSEAPIAGVVVKLFLAGVEVGTTTTDTNGNYVFVGVKPNTAYTIEIATGQGSLTGLVPTVADAAAVSPDGTQNDSDSDGVPDSLTAPTKVVAAVLTGGPGANDHTFDFGFHAPIPETTTTTSTVPETTTTVPDTTTTVVDPTTTVVDPTTTVVDPTTTVPGATTTVPEVTTTVPEVTTTVPGVTTTVVDPTTTVLGATTTVPVVVTTVPAVVTTVASTTTTTLPPKIDLALSKTLNTTGAVHPGATVAYTVKVTNNGPGTAKAGFSVTDVLPGGLSFASVAATGTGYTCAAPIAQSVTCTSDHTLGVLSGTAPSDTLTINAVVGSTAAGKYTNVAYVTPAAGEVTETNPLTVPTPGTDSSTTGTNNDGHADITVTPLYSVGNLVWSDTNNNGVVDGTETGVDGVTVNLLNQAGAVITTQQTTTGGYYLFTNLQAGDYRIEIVPPTGYISSTGTNGALSGPFEPAPAVQSSVVDSDDNGTATATTPAAPIRSSVFTLDGTQPTGEPETPGHTDPTLDTRGNHTVDFGIWKPASLGDTVWTDTNHDGIQDATETGVAGITVNLLDAAGAVIGTTTTDSNGKYTFDNLTPGTYSVEFVKATLPAGMVFTTQGSGTDRGTDSNADTTTGRSAPVTLVAGERNATIDAGIWKPASLGDTVWSDVNHDGIQDATETGVAGITVNLLDANGAVIGTTTTDANGKYTFDNLTPGTYSVEFVKATLPTGMVFTTQGSGTDRGTDSNADTTTGRSAPVTLVAGERNPTIDAGIWKPASLGDTVWTDTNHDGIQDATETGVAGITVNLLDAAGAVIASTTTDSNGKYTFDNLLPGTYSVEFVKSTLPTGMVFTTQGSGTDRGTDSNADTTTGRSAPVTLVAGERNPTIDAGIWKPASLGDTVWSDTNHDGIQDSTETGVAGITVNLLDADGNVITSTTTDANGKYTFDNLTPGTYSVEFVKATLPAGMVFTTQGSGTDRGTDSNADTTTGRSAPVTLVAGERNPTIDAGIWKPASLGDTVWSDVNHDGIQDSTETGVPGVTVNLLDTNGAVIASTTTDSNGKYTFDNLTPGTYSVEFVKSTLPTGMVFTTQGSGTDRGTDSNADTTTGRSAPVTLVAGERNPTIDAGIWKPASLGDTVWSDVNHDGIQDATETGVPGVTVNLLDANGAVIGTTTTDSNGKYTFDNLTPGTYSVEFVKATLPAGMVFTTQGSGTDRGTDSNADTTTGRSAPVTLVAGERNATIDAGIWKPTAATTTTVKPTVTPTVAPTVAAATPTTVAPSTSTIVTTTTTPEKTVTTTTPVAAPVASPTTVAPKPIVLGSIGDRVWLDRNNDGKQGPDELGIPQAKVRLTAPDGSTQTTTTDDNGNYFFAGLPAGTYTVEVLGTAKPSNGPAIRTVTLAQGANDLNQDFGYAQAQVNGIQTERGFGLAFTGANTLNLVATALMAVATGTLLLFTRRRHTKKTNN